MSVFLIYYFQFVDLHLDMTIIRDVNKRLINYFFLLHHAEHLHLAAILKDSLLDLIYPSVNLFLLRTTDDIVDKDRL